MEERDFDIRVIHALQTGAKQSKEVLIDTGSNCSVFNNKSLLTNIRKSESKLRAYSNGGFQDSSYIGDYKDFFPVWYNEKSLVNILSLADVMKKFRVTMDTLKENAIRVHVKNDKCLVFKEKGNGLYLLDNKNIRTDCNYSYLNMVEENKKLYTKRELMGADQARMLYNY